METKIVKGYRFFSEVTSGSAETSRLKSVAGGMLWPEKMREWVRYDGELELCASGLHGSTSIYDALRHRRGHVLGSVEARGVKTVDDGKFVAREMRITRVWCKQHVVALAVQASLMSLPIFEKRRPGDQRPRKAIELVIEWLRTGKVPNADLRKAAAAAYAADAAADAAYAAAYAAAAYAAAYAAAADAAAYAKARAKFVKKFNSYARVILKLPAGELAGFLEAQLGAPVLTE